MLPPEHTYQLLLLLRAWAHAAHANQLRACLRDLCAFSVISTPRLSRLTRNTTFCCISHVNTSEFELGGQLPWQLRLKLLAAFLVLHLLLFLGLHLLHFPPLQQKIQLRNYFLLPLPMLISFSLSPLQFAEFQPSRDLSTGADQNGPHLNHIDDGIL